MEKENILRKRYESLCNACSALYKVMHTLEHLENLDYYREFRDSKIQRFEFTVDLLWKFLKDYLEVRLRSPVEIASPREVFRSSLVCKSISDHEYFVLMRAIDDRNLTSHTYNEVLAQEVSERIDGYYPVIKAIIDRLKV